MTYSLHKEIKGKGQPLVLLHGWGWNSSIWNPIIPLLEPHYELHLIDLPGFGQSSQINCSYAIEEVVELIFKVVPECAAWLGWSLGGMIAWWAALHYPNKITRLITVASSPKFMAENDWPGVTPTVLEKFKLNLIKDYHQTLSDFLELQLRGSPNYDILLFELQNHLPTSKNSPLNALLYSLELLKTLDLRQDITKITVPSLHIFGSNDTLVPKKIPTLLQPLLPNSHFETINRTGHIPFLTHPELFLNQLLL